jgi:hypothetical protein
MEQLFERDINTSLPTKPGKYIVKTKTKMGNIHRLECNVTIDDKGHPHFHVTNQTVISWYEPLNIDLESLKEDSQKLAALEAAGVDNWEGYDIAMDMLNEWENEE